MTASCELRQESNGQLSVNGELAFSTVLEVLANSEQYFRNQDRIVIDLGGVEKTDSAGLALLVEWISKAETHQKPINFVNIPRQMMDIARVSGLDQILPV